MKAAQMQNATPIVREDEQAYRIRDWCAIHRAIANELVEEPHAVARVDFIQKHDMHQRLPPHIERRRSCYLGQHVLWESRHHMEDQDV